MAIFASEMLVSLYTRLNVATRKCIKWILNNFSSKNTKIAYLTVNTWLQKAYCFCFTKTSRVYRSNRCCLWELCVYTHKHDLSGKCNIFSVKVSITYGKHSALKISLKNASTKTLSYGSSSYCMAESDFSTVVLQVNGAYDLINKRVQHFGLASLDGFSMRFTGRYEQLISLVTADQGCHHSLPRQQE